MAQIRSKRQFFRMWEQGLLGNRTLLWRDMDAALAYRPEVTRFGFRELGRAGGGAWALSTGRADAARIDAEWRGLGRTFVIDGSVPNDHSVMQGEVCRTIRGLESYLCERSEWVFQALGYEGHHLQDYRVTAPGLPPMRITMANGWHRHRGYLETKVLLDRYLDPASHDDLDALLELYPDATVELTAFDVNVGNIPGRNTIFWECRDY